MIHPPLQNGSNSMFLNVYSKKKKRSGLENQPSMMSQRVLTPLHGSCQRPQRVVESPDRHVEGPAKASALAGG